MSELLDVTEYIENEYHHICKDQNGKLRRVDLIVSGCLPEGIEPQSLVGKTVKIDYTHPYLELAEGVEIVGS